MPAETFRQARALGYDLLIAGTQKADICRTQLANAQQAGMAIEAYIYLYFDGFLAARVYDALLALTPFRGIRVWLDVEEEAQASPQMLWPALRTLVERVQEDGRPVGIYTSRSKWASIMGDYDGFADLPLWDAHYTGIPTFDAFKPYGGWERPTCVQYAQNVEIVPGLTADLNVYRRSG